VDGLSFFRWLPLTLLLVEATSRSWTTSSDGPLAAPKIWEYKEPFVSEVGPQLGRKLWAANASSRTQKFMVRLKDLRSKALMIQLILLMETKLWEGQIGD
jgi:hypothetical protein